MKVEEEVLRRVSPSPELISLVRSTSDDLLSKVKSMVRGHTGVVDVRLMGSVAKDTYVDDPDVDVFILFDESVARPDMDELALTTGKKVLEHWEERYAEHPYLHGQYGGFEVDLVPCYHIKDTSHLMSAVDRTPFHTDFILHTLPSEKRQEVRLLKQFLKGIGAYGAEAKVQGFSGYLVELLIIRYGSFIETLRAASRWRFGTSLGLDDVNRRRFESPLVFIDPVDRSRNVASALSLGKFSIFVHASREYLSCPDPHFFFPAKAKNLTRNEAKRRLEELGQKVLLVSAPSISGIDDNVYPQVRKTLESLTVLLETEGFQVQRRCYVVRKRTYFAFLLDIDRLSDCRKHVGPPMWLENADDFLRRWRTEGVGEPYIEEGRWTVMARRRYLTAKELVTKELPNIGLGSGFRERRFQVTDHRRSIEKGPLCVLTELLDKRLSWQRK